MTRGAYLFVAFAYLVLAASFVASTGLVIREFAEFDWRAIVLMHSHLFVFFPVFGLLALAAFYVPSVAFTHMYWHHVPYGRLRFIVGFFVAVALSLGVSQWLASSELRGIWEISPRALQNDRSTPPSCGEPNAPCQRASIPQTIAKLREAGPNRVGLSDFARNCKQDDMLPPPVTHQELRYCFPALGKLQADACCRVQENFARAVGALRNEPASRSEAVAFDTLFLPFKVFFVTVMFVIALMLAFWRNTIDTLYRSQVRSIERGIMIGAIAMLVWPLMDYGYQQTSDVLFGRHHGGFSWRLSLVVGPWAVLLAFFFLRRFGKNLAMVGQIGGIAGGLFAVLRYQDINNWAQRFFGAGANDWMLYAFGGLALVGLMALLWPRRHLAEAASTPGADAGHAPRLARGPLT